MMSIRKWEQQEAKRVAAALGEPAAKTAAVASSTSSTTTTHQRLCAAINGKWRVLMDKGRAKEQQRHLLKSLDFVKKHCPPKELRRLAIGVLKGKYGQRDSEYNELPIVDIANKRRRGNDVGTQTDPNCLIGYGQLQRRPSDSDSTAMPSLPATPPYVPKIEDLKNVVVDLTDDDWLYKEIFDVKLFERLAAAGV